MRVFPCCCKTPFKLLVLLLGALPLLLLALPLLELLSWLWPESSLQNHVKPMAHVTTTELTDNLGIHVGDPKDLVVAPISAPSRHCLPGFYSSNELKPHRKRPPQDPNGPGADGKAFAMGKLSVKEVKEMQEGMKKNCFNQFASDRISLHRSLGKDTRHPECVSHRFPRCPALPTTSVIIVFHNEAWSTLLRTVYSVLHTAPAAFLLEILLVDDASTADHLQIHLEEHLRLLKIVRVLRQVERRGLIAARLLGAREAHGEVLTFLDAHCECFYGWLEPLLARIVEEPTAVVSPEIVIIDKDSFWFRKPVPTRYSYNRGIFHWDLTFGWEAVFEHNNQRRRTETDPIKTPTVAGGLFSVKKSYFEQIGTYDDKMEIWGGENLELSFRVWLCGGQLEIVRCSVVGHVFRDKSPHTFPNGTEVIAQNQVRLAEVWMGEYKKLFYRRDRIAAMIAKEKRFGDISDRLKLRDTLHCKNFSWYLENIYPEAYVPEINPVKYGSVKNLGSRYCLTVMRVTTKKLVALPCHNKGQNQYFEYTLQKELRHNVKEQRCLHATTGRDPVTVEPCQFTGQGTGTAPMQLWTFTLERLLLNKFSNRCLTKQGDTVIMANCNPSDHNQHWTF